MNIQLSVLSAPGAAALRSGDSVLLRRKYRCIVGIVKTPSEMWNALLTPTLTSSLQG